MAMDTEVGYDCEFVDTISADIQTDCSICLLILREPYIVQCCGNRFCKPCLEGVQSIVKDSQRPQDAPCPLCKQKIATSIPDRQLERLLNEKLVYCANRKNGCKWTGVLGKFETGHLVNECLYTTVLCSQCERVSVRRHALRSHMQNDCVRRIVVCTYCGTYRAAYEDIDRVHHPVCPYFPEPCPKGCGAKPFRKNLAKHLANSCPKNPQPCPFRVVGCTKKLVGKQMDSHLSDRAVLTSHLSAMEKTLSTLRKEIEEKRTQIRTLQKDATVKDILVKNLQCDMETKELDMCMMHDELKASEQRSSTLQDEVRDKEQEIKTLREDIKRLDCLKETSAQEIKEIKAALREKNSMVSALTKQVQEKDMQIKDLMKKQGVRDKASLKQLKAENTRFREHNMCLEVQVNDLTTCMAYLEDKAYQKAVHAETLEKEIAELQQVIHDQRRNIDRLTRTARRRYGKLSEVDKTEELKHEAQDIIDNEGRDITAFETSIPIKIEQRDSCSSLGPRNEATYAGDYYTSSDSEATVSLGVVTNRSDPPELEQQPVDPPTADDNSGVLEAALGIAVGVGIAGLAALLRR